MKHQQLLWQTMIDLRNYMDTVEIFGNLYIWIVPERTLHSHNRNKKNNEMIKYIIKNFEIQESLYLSFTTINWNCQHNILFIKDTGFKTKKIHISSLNDDIVNSHYITKSYNNDGSEFDNDTI